MKAKGNRKWAAHGGFHKFRIPNNPTKFEQLQTALGLADWEVPFNKAMYQFAKTFAKIRYVPEELLIFWGLQYPDDEAITGPEEPLETRASHKALGIREEKKPSQALGLPANADPGSVPVQQMAVRSLP